MRTPEEECTKCDTKKIGIKEEQQVIMPTNYYGKQTTLYMKPSLKDYFSPTPKRFRILGDSLASASVFVSSYAVLNDMKVFAVAVLFTGWAGKFLTNFFTEDVSVEKETETETEENA